MPRMRILAMVPSISMVSRISTIAIVGALLTGCVVEQRPIGAGSIGANEPRVAMPVGPVARPLTDVTISARIRVEVTPIGLVRYDGQVLPLLSPDGRFLVVEDGEAPTWSTLLATRGARPSLRTRLQVYEFTDKGMIRVNFASRLPAGLVLGRSANDAGFLVESPQSDGSRWIGLVDWHSGGVEWLVRDDDVNAHAVFTPRGHLVYTSRAVDSAASALMLRDRGGLVSRLDEEGLSFAFPTCTDEPGVVYVFVDDNGELLLRAIRIVESSVEEGIHVLGAVEAERRIVSNPTLTLVYQSLAGIGYGLPARVGTAERDWLPFMFVHPVLQRLVAFDRRDGNFSEFPRRSHACARTSLSGDEGYFVTMPDGLYYTMMSQIDANRGTPLRVARILDEAYIPRASSSEDRPLIVFGPTQGDRFELGILSLTIPPAPATPDR